MKRILVIRGGAIGDFVLTLPAIKMLRDEFESAHIEILGYKHIVALAENRFYANATRSIEYGALASFFARGAELPGELADYFGSFDLVVSYLFDPDGIFQRNLDRSGVDNFIAGDPKISGSQHAAVQLARPLNELNLVLRDPAARLYPSREDDQFAERFLGGMAAPFVAMHPGSGSERKNWSLEHWRELGESLLRDGIAGSLVVIGGEADEEQVGALKTMWRERSVLFATMLPLPGLAAVLARCALFVGHDSGISHIAAAAGTPSLLLFGPTDPAVWAPANKHVRVLQPASGVVGDLPVEDVYGVAESLVGREIPHRLRGSG
jgi:heptosyltransferase-2